MTFKKTNEYQLLNFREKGSQHIFFYELKEDGTFFEGTTLEEMLKVSIERLQDLNGRFPCRENSLAITKMEEALMWLNERTKNREKRGVEGKLVA